MRDLLIAPSLGNRPRQALEERLRTAIRNGRLVAGTALPSSRSLARDLGIARSTVVAAYEQLAAEGYVDARQGRSTLVADVAVPGEAGEDRNPMGRQPAHDFRPGEPSLGSFPRREWQRSMRRVLEQAPDSAFGYGDPRGRLELRESLARYLARVRNVHADATALRVYTGFASSLGFIGEMLRHRRISKIAVEDPMLFFHRQILELVGLETIRVQVDAEGLCVGDLGSLDVGAVLVTPANQQPLGVTLSPERRTALIAWARQNEAWIVEDDYDGEFRYDRWPIGAIQGLDADRVLYAGTASKSMGPGLHLSWLVVPRALRGDLGAVTHLRAGVSTLNQLALADFIDCGAYDRHVRQQRRVYQRRRVLLTDRLAEVGWLEVEHGRAGMHLLARFDGDAIDEAALIRAADAASIGLIGLQTHFEHAEAGLVLNVSRPADHHFGTATDALVGLLGRVSV